MKRGRSAERNLQGVPGVCHAVLDALLARGARMAPFVEAVDARLYPEYARLVARPMHVARVRARLDEGGEAYAGAAFARDVRLVFANAQLFNEPGDAVFEAAAEMAALFEREWRKFAPEPPELPLVAPSLKRPGKLVFKLPRPVAPPMQPGRAQTLALFHVTEALMCGFDLSEAAGDDDEWRYTADEACDLEWMVDAARNLSSAIEDTQSPEATEAWLQDQLAMPASQDRDILHYFLAVQACDERPFIDGLKLATSGPLAKSTTALEVVATVMAHHGCAERILALLQLLVSSLGKRKPIFESFIEQLRSLQNRGAVQIGLDHFVHWLLVELKPARTDVLKMVTGFSHLGTAIGRIAVDAVGTCKSVKSLK